MLFAQMDHGLESTIEIDNVGELDSDGSKTLKQDPDPVRSGSEMNISKTLLKN